MKEWLMDGNLVAGLEKLHLLYSGWQLLFSVFFISKKFHPGYIICVALVFAGALGNLLDSMFYGLIFDNNSFETSQIATIFPKHGYAEFLHGNVVDMLYLPIFHVDHLPGWIPFFGGKPFSFFNYIFNVADASVSIGVIVILLFKKRFFNSDKDDVKEEGTITENKATNEF